MGIYANGHCTAVGCRWTAALEGEVYLVLHAGQLIFRIGFYLYVLRVEGVNRTEVLQLET